LLHSSPKASKGQEKGIWKAAASARKLTAGGADGGDLAVVDYHCLIFGWRSACAVNGADARERHDWRVDRDEGRIPGVKRFWAGTAAARRSRAIRGFTEFNYT
jgi:hypothetical protein